MSVEEALEFQKKATSRILIDANACNGVGLSETSVRSMARRAVLVMMESRTSGIPVVIEGDEVLVVSGNTVLARGYFGPERGDS